MKLDPNMEIHSLLRRHARRGAVTPIASTLHNESGGGRAEESGLTHLDTDELNAFAENAVPAAARARYAAHLAECDACRKIVTELVMTSGVAQELERQAVKNVSSSSVAPARSWGARLSALFAPRTLRYAASVVLLVGLAATAFIVLREKRQMSSRTDEGKYSSNVSPNQNSDGQLADRNATATDQKVTNTNPATPPEGVLSKPDASGNAVPPTASGGESNDVIVSQPTPVEGPLDSPAPAPAVVPSGTLAGKVSEPKRDEEAVKTGRLDSTVSTTNEKSKDNKEVGGADSSASSADLAKNRADDDRNFDAQGGASAESKQRPANQEQSPATTTARKRAGARAQSPPASSAKSEADSRAEREDITNQPGESRRAGGRQFVRRGSAWVDTAYKSQATTNVKRNSDQYRALAADEPGLRAIADQLGGEVIIVWKGRAYRIR